MKLKIIIGPTQLVVERCGIKSPPVTIGDEYITHNSPIVKETYYQHVHQNACIRINQLRKLRKLYHNCHKEIVLDFITKIQTDNMKLFFDGPNNIISFKPWKDAKYGDWFHVDKKSRNLIYKMYHGVYNVGTCS